MSGQSAEEKIAELMAELDACPCHGGSDCTCGAACRCDELLEHLFELLDYEVPAEYAHRLLEHGRGCENCLETIRAELRVRAVIRRSFTDFAPRSLRLRITQLTIRRDCTD